MTIASAPLGPGAPLVGEMGRQVRERVHEDDEADTGREQPIEHAETVERERQTEVESRRPRQVDGPAPQAPADKERSETGARDADRSNPGGRRARRRA